LAAITPALSASLTSNQLAGLSSKVGFLTSTQIASLSTSALRVFNSQHFSNLREDEVRA